ncbi:hypothetical protein [Streptomyces youssoufiensis]
MAATPPPEPTPEQIDLIMTRLLGNARSRTDQSALFRIGKRAGYFWTHRDCPRSGVSGLTDQRCLHCGAPRPA